MGYIYKLTLLESTESFKKDEIYIGKHNNRKSEYFGSGKIIKDLRIKYGKNIFSREILAKDVFNEELLCYLEIYYIDLYKCNRSIYNKGLNLTNGGEGINGYKMTEKHRSNMKQAILKSYKDTGRKPHKSKLVHQYSLETGEYIQSFDKCSDAAEACNVKSPSSIAYCARGIINSVGGFSWSYEKVGYKLVNENHKKPIVQYSLKGEFIKEWKSATDAGSSLNFKNSSISNCCLYHSISAYGFIWRFKEDKSEIKAVEGLKVKPEIIQLDLEDNFIKKWANASSIEKTLGIHSESIYKCCRDKQKKAANFKWKFAV